jgi:hypothetical protein
VSIGQPFTDGCAMQSRITGAITMHSGDIWQIISVLQMVIDRLADAADSMDTEIKPPKRKAKRKTKAK